MEVKYGDITKNFKDHNNFHHKMLMLDDFGMILDFFRGF